MASMAELAKRLLTAKQPERYSQVMDRGPYSPGVPMSFGYGADDQMSPLDAAALITGPVPVVGDIAGLAADADMYMRDPESRNIPNYMLSAAGALPFLPAASQVRQGIKAYHGSPHDTIPVNEFRSKKTGKSYYVDAGKEHPVIKMKPDEYEFVDNHPLGHFDSSKIGTGEGAQQYGRGLYFAENEKVAKEYRDQLTERDLDYEDWLMGKYKDAESNQDYARMEMYERAMLNETPQDFKDLAADVDYDEDYRGLAAEVGEEIEEYGPDLGSMYEVNIDVEPDELLDWYQPISQQSKKVRDAVYANRDAVDQKIVDDYFDGDRNNIVNDEMTGMRYMSNMDQINAGTIDGTEYELAEKGVKGIRYADAFTRHKSPDKQSMNYVIFDDRLITIAKKYGVAIPVAAAMLARATGEDTSQSFQEET